MSDTSDAGEAMDAAHASIGAKKNAAHATGSLGEFGETVKGALKESLDNDKVINTLAGGLGKMLGRTE